MSFCVDPHTALSDIGTAYDDLDSFDSGMIEYIAVALAKGESQAVAQAAGWNSVGVGATVNGVYIDPDDYASNGKYGYSCDFVGGSGLQTMAINISVWPLGGYIKVVKKAASTTFNYLSNCPNNYSLANAEYGIYSDAACADRKATKDRKQRRIA